MRRLALTAHVTVSVGWIGCVLAYLALGVAAANGATRTARAAWTAMDIVGWYVIVPLAVASLVSGVAMALGTRWGLLRHYWVVFSLVLTAISSGVLLAHMPSVSAMAQQAQQADRAELDALGGDLAHPGIGLVVLVVVQVLNVYKPPGLTRYGCRRHNERREDRHRPAPAAPDAEPATRC